MLTWNDIAAHQPLYLNLGANNHCHPHPQYQNFVSVDLDPPTQDNWRIQHDLCDPIPLPDNSVDLIHTEDCLHVMEQEDFERVLADCYRLLKPGGRFRIGVPDYNSPKNCAQIGSEQDPRYPLHKVFTRREVMQNMLERSPFTRWEFQRYWDGDEYVQKEIDFSNGMIQRIPEHDPRCRHATWQAKIRNFLFRLKRGFRLSPIEKQCLEGQPLYATSLVVDCFK